MLTPCRATINLVGAIAGSRVLVDPDDPNVALLMEKGYLVADGDAIAGDESVAESVGTAGGESHADERLDSGAAVGDDADATLEPLGDSGDEIAAPAA
jgi:hypothetical protein